MFSNKEQRVYLEKYVASPSNHRINAITAKIRCRACSGEQVNERQCEGPCGQWKALDKFSKTQRSRGSGWCQECVLWKEAAEPGVVTEAAPNTMLAPDEVDPGAFGSQIPVARTYSRISFDGGNLEDGPEYGYDSDDDDYNTISAIQATESTLKVTPYVGMAEGMSRLGLGNQPHAASSTLSASSGPSNSKAGYVPPHLRSSIGRAADTNTGYVPPHMRGIPPNPSQSPHSKTSSSITPNTAPAAGSRAIEATTNSASKQFEASDSASSSNPWSAVDARRRVPGPTSFIGFNKSGSQHITERLASGETSAIPQSTSYVIPVATSTRGGKWAKAVSYISFICSN